jgi:hypothetical protein
MMSVEKANGKDKVVSGGRVVFFIFSIPEVILWFLKKFRL